MDRVLLDRQIKFNKKINSIGFVLYIYTPVWSFHAKLLSYFFLDLVFIWQMGGKVTLLNPFPLPLVGRGGWSEMSRGGGGAKKSKRNWTF
jgi:hypothetical protein